MSEFKVDMYHTSSFRVHFNFTEHECLYNGFSNSDCQISAVQTGATEEGCTLSSNNIVITTTLRISDTFTIRN